MESGMAGQMIGADTPELRQVAGDFGTKSGDVTSAKTTCVNDVQGVVWVGHDADTFRSHWSSDIAPMMAHLAEALAHVKANLIEQANAQDECSQGTGGAQGGPAAAPTPAPAPAKPSLLDVLGSRFQVETSTSAMQGGWTLKIPGFGNKLQREGGAEFKDGKWQRKDNMDFKNSKADHKDKWMVGLQGYFDFLRSDLTVRMPSTDSKLNAFARLTANVFGGAEYDRVSREAKVGFEAFAGAEGQIAVTQKHGYLTTNAGVVLAAGYGAEGKLQFMKDGVPGFAWRAKLVEGVGGGLTGYATYDFQRAYHDATTNPMVFLNNSMKDMAVANPALSAFEPIRQRLFKLP